jgi:nitrous oxidase accessory protein NosD
LGQNDEIRLSNCAVVSAAIAFHFMETRYPTGKMGSTWGGMENCSVDSSAVGLRIDAANSLRIHGGSIWAHHYGVELNGRGNIILSGIDIRANGAHGLHIKDCDSVTVTGCLFKKNGPSWPTTAKVQIEGGQSVLVSGCTFDETSVGIHITSKAMNFSITGNCFPKMPHAAIADQSGPNARKLLGLNLAG